MEQFIKKRIAFILADLVVVFLSFLLIVYIKAGNIGNYLPKYSNPFLLFLGIWLVFSWLFRKYYFRSYDKLKQVISPVLISNFIILGTASILMFFLRTSYFSRIIVLGTIITASLLELIMGLLYHFIKVAKDHEIPVDYEYLALKKHEKSSKNNHIPRQKPQIHPLSDSLKDIISSKAGEEAVTFIQRQNGFVPEEILVLITTNPFNILAQSSRKHKYIVNLKRVNDIRHINGFFETVNDNLPEGGFFTCCVETKDLRKKRLFRKYPFLINYFYYYLIDFPVKRVMPKLKITRGLYFVLTRGQNQVITRAETLGRLISCGFEIVDEDYIRDLCYITARKVKAPVHDTDSSYGPLIRLKRVGKEGKIIRVYKMRTMHPFAEYLQDYIYERYNLAEGGKFNSDFRISTQGKIMRMLWLDELPMLINWMKGDMKFVGIRPISEQYFLLYSEEHRLLRIQYKPGLVPPYYADMPKTLEEIQTSERKYMEAYEKNPVLTDWQYFWRAMYNIIFKKARSR